MALYAGKTFGNQDNTDIPRFELGERLPDKWAKFPKATEYIRNGLFLKLSGELMFEELGQLEQDRITKLKIHDKLVEEGGLKATPNPEAEKAARKPRATK